MCRCAQALSEGGRIDMPLQQTFGAKRFGVFVDRFGTPWTINCEWSSIGAADPTAHAEIVALRRAARQLQNYRLPGTTLDVTIEPRLMCVGAMVHARIGRLVYGAAEPEAGAIESAMRALDHPTLNHRFDVVGGVLADESRELMQSFFHDRRRSDRTEP